MPVHCAAGLILKNTIAANTKIIVRQTARERRRHFSGRKKNIACGKNIPSTEYNPKNVEIKNSACIVLIF